MIVELKIKLKHNKRTTLRDKSFFFNITDKGVLFTEDTIDDDPLFVFKKFNLSIIEYIDFVEQFEEIHSWKVVIDGKHTLKTIEEDFSTFSDTELTELVQNLYDYKEPENLELKSSFEFQMFMRQVQKEQKKKVKHNTEEPKVVDTKIADVKYLIEEQKYLVVFKHNKFEVKYIFDDLMCCCCKSATRSFVELVLGVEEDYDTKYYFYDDKNKTKLWNRSGYDSETLEDLIFGYLKAMEYKL